MKRFVWGLLLTIGFYLLAGCNFEEAEEQKKEPVSQQLKPEKISFHANDSLLVNAHLYEHAKDAPVMILCHQAGYCKMEYAEIARELVKRGFTCLAIDQRSGGSLNGHINETNARAQRKDYKISYLDAEKDIVAAVHYVDERFQTPIILVGSSYSASLALKVAKEAEQVDAVAAFSPGEYFGDWLKLKSLISDLDKPVFVTSSRKEAGEVQKLIEKVNSTIKHQYIPTGYEGVHGAKALWPEYKHCEKYWHAFDEFLVLLRDHIE